MPYYRTTVQVAHVWLPPCPMPYTVAFAALVVISCDAFVPLPLQSHPQTSSYGYHHRQSSRQHVVSVVTGDGSTSQQLRRIITDDVLPRMISFFSLDMVDSSTNRFYYLCRPPTGEHEHRHMPIRDLAAAWDATKALLFLEKNDAISDQGDYYWNDAAEIRQRLREAVHATLEAYHPLVPTEDGAGTGCDGPSSELTLDSNNTLKETANIAHSALLLMTTLNAHRLSILPNFDANATIRGLVKGILSRQRPDGAFRIEFDGPNKSDVYKGIDFFPGEAMLALMEAYDLSESGGHPCILDESARESIVSSLERGYMFYRDYCYEEKPDVNFNIFQVVSFSRFYDVLERQKRSDQATFVAHHVLQMCRDIVNSRAWKELKQGQKFYPNLNTVEIVCGLDALAEGIRVATAIDDGDTAALLNRNAMNAVYFVEWSQSQVSKCSPRGYGGLGFGGVQVLEQRLDITGHALSALVKLCRVL